MTTAVSGPLGGREERERGMAGCSQDGKVICASRREDLSHLLAVSSMQRLFFNILKYIYSYPPNISKRIPLEKSCFLKV